MIDTIQARTIIVLADCHIHPARGIDWPQAALKAFEGADLCVTLGDMGEQAGLDALAERAPVIGVRGRDDGDDPRTSARLRLLKAGKLRIGCVFDPVETGVASQTDPLICASADELLRLFGEAPDALLWASTHRPSIERANGRLMVNPGSATLPADNAPASFARLTLAESSIEGEIVALRDRQSG
jgi:putative phosphoesterase